MFVLFNLVNKLSWTVEVMGEMFKFWNEHFFDMTIDDDDVILCNVLSAWPIRRIYLFTLVKRKFIVLTSEFKQKNRMKKSI